MNALFKIAMATQRNEQESGKRWGVVENGGAGQAKKSLSGDPRNYDVEGGHFFPSRAKDPKVYRPLGGERKMDTSPLKLDSGTGEAATAGRKMLPGQPNLDSNGSVRKMLSGQPALTMSTGGMRRMGSGQPVLTNAEGVKVASSKPALGDAEEQKEKKKLSIKKELLKNYLPLAI